MCFTLSIVKDNRINKDFSRTIHWSVSRMETDTYFVPQPAVDRRVSSSFQNLLTDL